MIAIMIAEIAVCSEADLRLPCLAACELMVQDSNLLWPCSMAPMEEASWHLHNASTMPFQGGGISIGGGGPEVTITSSNIHGNTASQVNACFLNFPGMFFHGADGRNFKEPSQCKHLALPGSM